MIGSLTTLIIEQWTTLTGEFISFRSSRLATGHKAKPALLLLCFLAGLSLVLCSAFYSEWITSPDFPAPRLVSLIAGVLLLCVSIVGFWLKKDTINNPVHEKEKEPLAQNQNQDDCLCKLKEAEEKLIAQEKMVQVGLLTAGIAHEIKNPLNFVTNFSKMSLELLDELKEAIVTITTQAKEDDKENVQNLLEDLTTNMTKIAEHGKRAESIVMNMLAQSRSGDPAEKEWVELNTLIQEDINLAYHGIRAHDTDFNIKIETDLQDSTGKIQCLGQAIGRVLLNIINNGMYAAFYRTSLEPNHQPIIKVSSSGNDQHVEIKIRDNGIGIKEEHLKDIFQPFFTTKPKGQGTGLGLSICHDIITKQHQGKIKVDSKVGEYTEFTITLPRE